MLLGLFCRLNYYHALFTFAWAACAAGVFAFFPKKSV